MPGHSNGQCGAGSWRRDLTDGAITPDWLPIHHTHAHTLWAHCQGSIYNVNIKMETLDSAPTLQFCQINFPSALLADSSCRRKTRPSLSSTISIITLPYIIYERDPAPILNTDLLPLILKYRADPLGIPALRLSEGPPRTLTAR